MFLKNVTASFELVLESEREREISVTFASQQIIFILICIVYNNQQNDTDECQLGELCGWFVVTTGQHSTMLCVFVFHLFLQLPNVKEVLFTRFEIRGNKNKLFTNN